MVGASLKTLENERDTLEHRAKHLMNANLDHMKHNSKILIEHVQELKQQYRCYHKSVSGLMQHHAKQGCSSIIKELRLERETIKEEVKDYTIEVNLLLTDNEKVDELSSMPSSIKAPTTVREHDHSLNSLAQLPAMNSIERVADFITGQDQQADKDRDYTTITQNILNLEEQA